MVEGSSKFLGTKLGGCGPDKPLDFSDSVPDFAPGRALVTGSRAQLSRQRLGKLHENIWGASVSLFTGYYTVGWLRTVWFRNFILYLVATDLSS